MNPARIYIVALIVFFPIFVALHGFMWVSSSKSFAPAVYAMKLIFVPFIAVALIQYWKEIMAERVTWLTIGLTAPVFLVSLATPFLDLRHFSPFYYVTDSAGLFFTVVSIIVFYIVFQKKFMDFFLIEKIFAYFCMIMSIYMIIYYVASGGDKISITPEMHIPIAIVLGAYLAPVKGGYRSPIWLIVLIALACVLSQLRENLVVYVIVGAVCLLRNLIFRSNLRASSTFLVATFAIALLVPVSRTLILDRLASMEFSLQAPLLQTRPSPPEVAATAVAPVAAPGAPVAAPAAPVAAPAAPVAAPAAPVAAPQVSISREVFTDGSLNQRVIEMDLMLKELSKSTVLLVLGKGFGATYENKDNILIYYGPRVHNAHSTPFLVYFRNGLYGVILYAIPLLLAMITLLSKDIVLFRASLALLVMYTALFFNQYFYWGFQFGLAVALWIYCYQRRNAT